MKPFVHLHLHTEYSLLDGAARIDRLFSAAKQKNMPAVAITDHGVMYGIYEFYKKARAEGIKPIIGCEFYMTRDRRARDGYGQFHHLVLLAKDIEGYKNIIKLDSLAFVEGFYYKPRIDMELLKQHCEGVICLSACLAGEIPQLLLKDDYEGAKKVAAQFKALFGEDYYIEIQDHGLAEQKYTNPQLIKIARELGIKLVATNDVHYIEKTDARMHEVLLCVQTGKTLDDPQRMRFGSEEFYLKDYDEMHSLFSYIPEALDNTLEIAEKCNVEITRKALLPSYTPDDGSTPDIYLRNLTYDGLKRRYGEITGEISERADYELGIIDRMGFNEYYLIVWDFINFARQRGIPVGAGRGSGVGSIVAYAVGITNVEPLGFNLLFERFLNPERQSMPDFDIDFCFERRGEVIEYVKNKYGADKVCQIVTFGTLASKNAIKDVGRVHSVPYAEVDRITKQMTGKGTIAQQFGLGSFEGSAENIELRQMYDSDSTVRMIVDMAVQLEGLPRNTSTHAAGVVICKDAISDHIPVQKNGEDVTTQFNMIEVEELGLLKMDFLGLRTLTDIKKAVDYVAETTGVAIDFDAMGLGDKGAYQLIGEGDTDAVFQLESPGMKRFMRELQPDCMEDIIAGISLYRPGPMNSIPKYIEGKRSRGKVTYKHPMLEEILNVTYGCIVYQEQVMQICRSMAGFSFGQADVVRRAMGKKDLKQMQLQKKAFINGGPGVDGALKRGVSMEAASDIFDEMEGFAKYAFNKSHAAAYAVLAYQTAYLKKYYRTQFITAVLNNRITNIEEITKYVNYCRAVGITVHPPDINQSRAEFSVEDGSIRFGLCAVKNVGVAAAEKIVEERKSGGKFTSLTDFFMRVDPTAVNKRLIESLIWGGAFDCLDEARSRLIAGYERIMERVQRDRRQRDTGQLSLFGDVIEESLSDDLPKIDEYDSRMRLGKEKEVLGVYITGHPLEDMRALLEGLSFNTGMLQSFDQDESGEKIYHGIENEMNITAGGTLTEVRKIVTRAGTDMAVARLEDLYGSIEVVFYSQAFKRCRALLIPDTAITVSGKLIVRPDEEVRIRAEQIKAITQPADYPAAGGQAAAAAERKKSRCKLYLKFAEENYDEVWEVLQGYPGDAQVIARIGKKAVRLPGGVYWCGGLESELLSLDYMQPEGILYSKADAEEQT